VADMDFSAPLCVTKALEEKSRHGIFGYSESGEQYFEAVRNWYSSNFGYNIKRGWLVKTPGVVYAICTAIRALTQESDAVLIQQPVYYPFTESILANKRKLVVNQLVYTQGKYKIDFEDFENQIVSHRVKLFILCSPHNPVGRVWTKEELLRLGELCHRYGVVVVSDEIHADFVFPGNSHNVFAGINSAFEDFTITCTAPSKTFNLAGLQISNIFIKNPKIRDAFKTETHKSGYSQLNIMGMVACRAAYEQGLDWLIELRAYLAQNLAFLRDFLAQRLPQIRLVEPQGTYLVWLDCKALGLSDKELDRLMVHKAGLWLDGGAMFGSGGEGFQRVNIACPRSVLEKALSQLEKALKER
jgi:cysteine-S-conjugate beta-lyase